MNEERLQEEQQAGIQEEERVGIQEEEQAGIKAEERAALQEEKGAALQEEKAAALQEEKGAILQEEKEAGLQEEKGAALQEEKEAGLQEEKGAALQEEKEAGLQEEKGAALQEEKGAALQEEKGAALQEEKGARLQEEKVAEFSWSPSYDTRPTDVTLVVESWKFYAHRDTLMTSSDYFSAMFSSQMIESREGVVKLRLVTPEVFKVLIEAMYTREIELSESNVFAVVDAAEMFQIRDPMRSVYISFLRDTFINLSQCFELMDFCMLLNLKALHCNARKFCLAHLFELKHSTTLTNLSLSKLYDYLSDKYLVVDAELHVVEAVYSWVCANKNTDTYNSEDYNLRRKVKIMLTDCVTLKREDEDTYDIITDAVFSSERLPVEHFKSCLGERPRREEVYMFWAMLTSSRLSEGLTDVLKLDVDTGIAVKVGSMTTIVEKPGFQLGSATCYRGPYLYLSGGGPDFGKVNWIRKIWRFDVSKLYSPWETVGELFEIRRNHAMVILENKLYIFGGFGKFRTKNTQMHSLDLTSGEWEELAPMPAHEFNPPATAVDNYIYYMSSSWTLHSFSLETREWTHLDLISSPFANELHEVKPLTLFPFKANDIECFAVAVLVRKSLRIQLLYTHKQTKTLHSLREVADMTNEFTFANSVGLNGKLVIFFTSQKSDDPFSGQNEASTALQKAWRFDPSTNQYRCFPNVQNVRQALSVVAFPYFPNEFSMQIKEF